MSRNQRGWLRVEERKAGETWVLRYNVTRPSDGKRVEHTKTIGLLSHFPTEATAWAEVERQNLNVNKPDFKGRVTFADLCCHYLDHEVLNPARKQQTKAHTTVEDYKRIVTKRLVPRFGKKDALRIQPLEIETWLDSLMDEEQLQNPTLDKYRRQMFLVYKHGQRYGLIPRTQEANPLRFVRQSSSSDYEAIVITAENTFEILQLMPQLERTLTLLIAATGLRISECLGLQLGTLIGRNKKSMSAGHGPAEKLDVLRARHPRLRFRSMRFWPPFCGNGKATRCTPNLTIGYLPASDWMASNRVFPTCWWRITCVRQRVKAGVPELLSGQKVRFGFHNLRHSLASFLVDSGTDPKTVQDLLRQADVQTTLKFYAHSKHSTKLAAQGQMLEAILQRPVSEAIN